MDEQRGVLKVSLAVFREIDSTGFGPPLPIQIFGQYKENEVGCKFQCSRALVLPGQIYMHEVADEELRGRSSCAWIINGVTRKRWDHGVNREWLEDSVVWTLKWARRHGVTMVQYFPEADSGCANGEVVTEAFNGERAVSVGWGVGLVLGDAGASGIQGRRRRGFGEIRGEML